MADATPRTRRSDLVVVYGLAHFGKSLFWNTSSLIFAFFLTETVGLTPETMGYVLAASLAFNAVLDLSVGRALGRRVRSARAAAKAQFVGGLFAAAAFLAFSATALVGEGAQLVYALATVLLFRLGYSLYDVPQNAFMGFASATDAERATLAATRYIAAGGSILVIALVFAPIVRESDPDTQAMRFLQVTAALVLVSVICSAGLLRFALTRLQGKAGLLGTDGAQTLVASGAQGPRDLFPFLLAGIFILSLTSPFFTKLEAYFTAYVLTHELSAMTFMACVAVGKTAVQPLWARLAAKTSLVTTLQWAAAAWGLAAFGFFALGRVEPWGTIATALAVGAASGGVFMALWSLLAREAGRDPSATTRRFGLFTFFSKNAQAAGMLALGYALGLFDYTGPDAAVVLSALMTGAPVLGGAALLVLALWMAMRSRQAERTSLTQREAASAPSSPV